MFETSEQWTTDDIERAAKVAKRLLGHPPPGPAGSYTYVHAKENLNVGDFVIIDSSGEAAKWKLPDNPFHSGVVVNSLTKGCYGWILKS